MGGERASTTRQRETGKICWECRSSIDKAPWEGGERLCDRCQRKRSSHRVLMNFMLNTNWHISFLEEDCKTSLKRKLTFADPDKILEMARKGGAELTSADRENMAYAIGMGRGGIWLKLTDEQYRKLK